MTMTRMELEAHKIILEAAHKRGAATQAEAAPFKNRPDYIISEGLLQQAPRIDRVDAGWTSIGIRHSAWAKLDFWNPVCELENAVCVLHDGAAMWASHLDFSGVPRDTPFGVAHARGLRYALDRGNAVKYSKINAHPLYAVWY